MSTLTEPAEGVNPESVNAFVAEQWPLSPNMVRCIEISGRHALTEAKISAESIRPGGYISGPTQFAVADASLWYACFGAIGLEAMALTSEMSIRFLRPAIGETLHCRVTLDSVGSRQIVGTVAMWTDDQNKPASIAQGTYVAPRP